MHTFDIFRSVECDEDDTHSIVNPKVLLPLILIAPLILGTQGRDYLSNRYSNGIQSSIQSVQVDGESNTVALIAALEDLTRSLAEKQKDLPPKAAEILFLSRWKWYE